MREIENTLAGRRAEVRDLVPIASAAQNLLSKLSRLDRAAQPAAGAADQDALAKLSNRVLELRKRRRGVGDELRRVDRQVAKLRAELATVWGRFTDFVLRLFDKTTKRERLDRLRTAATELEGEADGFDGELSKAGGQLRTALYRMCIAAAKRMNERKRDFDALLRCANPPAVQGWGETGWNDWPAADAKGVRRHQPVLPGVLRVGRLDERVRDNLPEELRGEALDWILQEVTPLAAPALLPFIGRNKTLVVEAAPAETEEAVGLLRSLVFRALALLGRRVTFTLLDPSGLGRAFPMQRFLPKCRKPASDVAADLDAVLGDIRRINGEVLLNEDGLHALDPRQLDREPFDLVFVANFPRGFDRRSVETLLTICENGPRAGRYVFLHHNTEHPLPHGIEWRQVENRYVLRLDQFAAAPWAAFTPDGPPPQAEWESIARAVKDSAEDRLAFDWAECVGLAAAEQWQESAVSRVVTPVGVRGATDKVEVWFGVDQAGKPCSHGVLAGQTGSGKSNLYHTLILGLAVRYRPEELQLYLIDGKFGVEFEPYQTLPHARVVSLKSSPELARSVLEELYREMERRNELFPTAGAHDYATYRTKSGKTLPRLLLLVDEYDFLFEDDRDGEASDRLRQLAEKGRSAGIHMLLGKQTFGAPGMLYQRDTFNNFQLRLSFKQNPDAIAGMTEFGRAGRELLRGCDSPGKFVLTATGRDEDCVSGMAAKMDRERLPRVVESLADGSGDRPVIFRGDVAPPALDNDTLRRLCRGKGWADGRGREAFARREAVGPNGGLGLADWRAAEHPLALWLGRRLSVHGHAVALLRRAPCENLAVLAGTADARAGVLAGTLLAIAALYKPDEVEVRALYAGADPEDPVIRTLDAAERLLLRPLGFKCHVRRDPGCGDGIIDDAIKELDARGATAGRGRPSVLTLLIDPERVPALRRIGDPLTARAPRSEHLRRLLAEGPPCGMHLAVVANGRRGLGQVIAERQDLPLFNHRVGTQMSEHDSFDLFGDRRAAQLRGDGGQTEAGLYFNNATAERTKFRPYAAPLSAEALRELSSLASALRAAGG